jgi:hypothetical protein
MSPHGDFKENTMAPRAKMAVNKWDAQLAELGAAASATEDSASSGGSFIGTKGGRLSYKGGEVPGNKMNVIVIDHILENAYYQGSYQKDNPLPPVCFAFGRDAKDMKPHELSAEPQCETCKDCEWNKFGSADTGRGKACKNIRRLALITEDGLDNVLSAEVVYLKTPVTSGKAWTGYVKQLNDVFKKPPLAFVTEVASVPKDENFEFLFKNLSEVTDGPTIGELLQKYETVKEDIFFPYQPAEEAPAAPARGRAKTAPAKAMKGQAKAAPVKPVKGRR